MTIHRTRAGRHGKAAGAWSWSALGPQSEELAGSAYPAGEVIRAHREGRVTVLRSDWPGGHELIVEAK